MKIIYVDSKKYGRKEILVDDSDYDFLNQWKWCVTKQKVSDEFYAVAYINREITRMHRLILGLKKGDKREGDHINHNGLDNQRKNIRASTIVQNSCNRKKQKGNYSSKYKGVVWLRNKNRWRVMISKKYIGTYCDEIDAAKAYDEAAKIHHGEFALTNF